MIKYARILGFASLLCAIQWADCSAEDLHEREEASALISGCISNLESLSQFDVLMRYETQVPQPDENILTKTLYTRVMFDAPNQLCLGISRQIISRLQTDNQDDKQSPSGKETRQEGLMAAVHKDKKGWIRTFPQPAFSVANATVLKVLGRTAIPNVQTLGLGEFNTPYMDEQYVEAVYETLKSETRPFRLSKIQNNIHQITCEDKSKFGSIRTILKVDVERCVPVFLTRILVRGEELVPLYQEQLKYKEQDGRFLPIKIEGEKGKTLTASDGSQFVGVEIYDVDLKWLSVGESLDEDEVDPTMLNDVERLMKMVGPELFDES